MLLALLPMAACAAGGAVLERMFAHVRQMAEQIPDTLTTNVYQRGHLRLIHHNITLAAAPTMYHLVRRGRQAQTEHFWEEYGASAFYHDARPTAICNIRLTTAPHRRHPLPSLTDYVQPRLYAANLFKGGILSPLCAENRKFYRYQETPTGAGVVRISFRSKLRSTQLVRQGNVTVDAATGRILAFTFEAEFDLVHFTLRGAMPATAEAPSIFPETCDMDGLFRFLGNRVGFGLNLRYGLPVTLPDSLVLAADTALMAALRPMPLTAEEQALISAHYKRRQGASRASSNVESAPDSAAESPSKADVDTIFIAPDTLRLADDTLYLAADTLFLTPTTYVPGEPQPNSRFWSSLGQGVLRRIHTRISDRGNLSLSPLLNPLYFGYSRSKGFVYRLSARARYAFSDDADIALQVRGGYSFKQHRAYFRAPLTWTFTKRHNGYVFAYFETGNRISDSSIRDEVISTSRADTIRWDRMNLTLFKDLRFRAGAGYGILRHFLDLEAGADIHVRRAVDKAAFLLANRQHTYRSVAPYAQLRYYPLGRSMPWVATTTYEQGVRALGGDIPYRKLEFDTQAKHLFSRMRTLSLRAGFGGYIHYNDRASFIYYENFQQDNIPGGWNDSWTGEFELLKSAWYNASDYYVRFNATYESPLLLLSWVPTIGTIVEQERIYFSAATLRGMNPYVEAGYGFTNRVFSLGVFTGFSPHRFEGVGVKLGFELFGGW